MTSDEFSRAAAGGAQPGTRAKFWERVEFALGQDLPPGPIGRRQLLELAQASAALAGLSGCARRPRGELVPHAADLPEHSPGERVRYATSMVLDGLATGLLVDSCDGRPIKIEGNPAHPASRGATLAIHQGSLLQLYDPDRARAARQRGLPRPSARVLAELAARPPVDRELLVLPPQSSPLALGLLRRITERHPALRVAFYAPLSRSAVYRGAELAFGQVLEPIHRLQRAQVIVALDADFLAAAPTALCVARDAARGRRPERTDGDMSRIYVAEAAPTATGSLSDHRLPLRPSQLPALLAHLAHTLGAAGAPLAGAPATLLGSAAARLPERARRFAEVAARDLMRAGPAGVVLVGDGQPAELHALAHLVHAALARQAEVDARSSMAAVVLKAPAVERPTENFGPAELAAAIEAGEVERLTLLEVDPLATAPGHVPLSSLLRRVDDLLHYHTHFTATSALSRRFVPAAHYLERWGDARALDGTHSLIQPLIAPLYDTPSLPELLAALAGELHLDVRARLRDTFDQDPRRAEATLARHLGRGFVEGSAFASIAAEPRPADRLWSRLSARLSSARPVPELQVLPSNALWDGRFANVPWLQELPDPITKQTWGNAALMAEADAARDGLEQGDIVRIENDAGVFIELPALPLPEQPSGVVSVATGYGVSERGAKTARLARGGNVYRLWRDRRGRQVAPVALVSTGHTLALARTQQHFDPHDRDIAPSTTLDDHRARSDTGEPRARAHLPSLLPSEPAFEPRWQMVIDTGACTGCNACMVACQAENNVPTVGPTGVRAGREMHWLRIDTYRGEGGLVHQPMLCQHCEHAPCEYVCPVGATVHSFDGLNEMIYNRCVGTRFCSNNCPYKVRRFNWLEYNGQRSTRDLALSPDVSVRARGVMEKCSYCVQRIRRAGIEARARGDARPAPGAVQTACQQACPTSAIDFGQQGQGPADATRARAESRRYEVLRELGTRPSTSYLAKIRNPNPELDDHG